MALLNNNIKDFFQSHDSIKKAIVQTDVYNKQQFKRYQNIYYTDKYDLNSYYYKGVFKNLQSIMDKNKLSNYKRFIIQNKPIAPDQKFNDIKKYDHLLNIGVSNVQSIISQYIQTFKPTSLLNTGLLYIVNKQYLLNNVIRYKTPTQNHNKYFGSIDKEYLKKAYQSHTYLQLQFIAYTMDNGSKIPYINNKTSSNIPSIGLSKYNITYGSIEYYIPNPNPIPIIDSIWDSKDKLYEKFYYTFDNTKKQSKLNIGAVYSIPPSNNILIYTSSNNSEYDYISKLKKDLYKVDEAYNYDDPMITIDGVGMSGSYVSDYSLNYDSQWSQQQAIGHQMPVHTYIGLTKAFNTQFTVVLQNKENQNTFIQQMNTLKKKVRPNIIKDMYQSNETTIITIKGHKDSFVGILTSLNIEYMESMFHIDDNKKLHPMIYQVTLSMTITQ